MLRLPSATAHLRGLQRQRRFSPPASWLRRAVVLPVVLGLFGGIAGCRQVGGGDPVPLRSSLFLAVGVTREEILDTALQQELRSKLGRMVEAFRSVEPGIRIQLQVVHEDRLLGVITTRNSSGLGPDLLLVTQQMAEQMAERNLIRPIRLPPQVKRQITPIHLQRVSRPDGSFIGVPVAIFPQLACFDRRRVTRSPETLEELEQAIASGMRVNLPIEPGEMAWTIGSTGAMESFLRLRRGEDLNAEDRRRIRGWLSWLEQMGLMQRFSFSLDTNDGRQRLMAGELDWTSCRSNDLNRLRAKLGSNLGVAPLPSSPSGAASPVSQLWMLTFGVNSSQRQRQAARLFGSFTINPQMQRVMTLRGLEGLPVNREVDIPVESSFVLRSLVLAQEQGRDSDPLLRYLHPSYPISLSLRSTLSGFLFGLKDLDMATEEVIRALRSHDTP